MSNKALTHEVVSRCLALIPLIREHQGMTLDELSRLSRLPKEQIADELGQVLLMCGVPPYFPHDYISFSLNGDRVQIRFADHFESLLVLELQRPCFIQEFSVFDGIAYFEQDPLLAEGFLDEIECAQFGRTDRGIDICMPGDDDNRYFDTPVT